MIKKSNLTVISTITVIGMANLAFHSVIADSAIASSDADYSFTISSDLNNCQQIGSAYQAVYAFETASFYVNICQKDNAYFYSGETKYSDRNSIFIPADPLKNGNGFKAENGNVSYLVILPFSSQSSLKPSDSDRSEAILTIKRNDILVSVESSLQKYCHQSDTTVAWDTIELEPRNYNRVATIPQHQDVGVEFSLVTPSDRLLPSETFNSDSRFDFYRLGGEIHRLTTCN